MKGFWQNSKKQIINELLNQEVNYGKHRRKDIQTKEVQMTVQEKLAELVGVSRQTIYKWESGYDQSNAENIDAICDALGVEKSYFYDGAVIKTPENADNELIYQKKQKVISVFSITVTSILLYISAIITAIITPIAFTTNSGDLVGNTANVGYGTFYISLFISIALLALDLFLIIYTVKRNVNKNKT